MTSLPVESSTPLIDCPGGHVADAADRFYGSVLGADAADQFYAEYASRVRSDAEFVLAHGADGSNLAADAADRCDISILAADAADRSDAEYVIA